MSMPLQGRGDDAYDDNARWEEQDMPYLSCDWRRAEGGEGDVNGGIDNDRVDGCVRGPRLADTRNGRQWRLWRDGDNDNNVEEGASHPTTPKTMVTCELAERLHSASCNCQCTEEGEGNVDDSGDNEHVACPGSALGGYRGWATVEIAGQQ